MSYCSLGMDGMFGTWRVKLEVRKMSRNIPEKSTVRNTTLGTQPIRRKSI
jgi:hypothetical protein